MMDAVSPAGPRPWKDIMPGRVFKVYFKELVAALTEACKVDLPYSYHETAWQAGSRVLDSFRPAKIDSSRLNSHLATTQTSSALASFTPNRLGYARPVSYDRHSTRTGRLTVASGPEILTVARRHRDVVISSFPGGEVLYVDFRALEARIVLAEAGRASPPGDVYETISQDVFGGRVKRDDVKTGLISELYGSSKSSLSRRLGVTGKALDDFVRDVREHFGLTALGSRLAQEYSMTGRLRNKHGRPVSVADPKESSLINTYAQSSGVDVSLMGFDQLLGDLGDDGIRPLYVIHDGLVLDVRSDRIKDVKNVSEVPVAGYVSPFPLKVEKFSSTSDAL